MSLFSDQLVENHVCGPIWEDPAGTERRGRRPRAAPMPGSARAGAPIRAAGPFQSCNIGRCGQAPRDAQLVGIFPLICRSFRDSGLSADKFLSFFSDHLVENTRVCGERTGFGACLLRKHKEYDGSVIAWRRYPQGMSSDLRCRQGERGVPRTNKTNA